jgi:hypothetical protein
MTNPSQQPQVPLVDAGNALLAPVPAQMHAGMVNGPDGKTGVITVRTSSATLTVFLGAADLRSWASLLTALADELTGGLAQATAADIAVLSQPSARHRRG